MCVCVFNQLHRVFMMWLTKKLVFLLLKTYSLSNPPLLAIQAISILEKLGH